jgi:glycosyltransferase involved in cell wall biosynthesis
VSPARPDRLRAGFVMEQVLGHVSHYRTLRAAIEREPEIDARWVEVTYEGAGRLEHLRPVPPPVRATLRGFLQVRDGLRGAGLDAILFHTQKPAVFQWDLLARTPTVLSLDVTPRQYDELGAHYDHTPDADNSIARFKHWLNRRTFAYARLIVVWSNWVKGSLVADYGIPADRVRVIPPGVDLTLWTPPERTTRQLPRILFVGGDFERKGGTLLMDWFRQHGRGRCELDIVTRAQLAPEPGVRVHRGIVGNSREARQMFAAADIFILPSLGECFGIASVEAMAAGLPVVATLVGGSADIVDHGETGFLIPPNDTAALGSALDSLLGDPSLRKSMGQRGRQKAEQRFDGAHNARALLGLLREAAA